MDVKKLVAQMTLEEKAGLCSGLDFWHTKPVERLGVPSVMVSDGPHGLRKQAEGGDHLGINESIKAVCFPTGSCLASSFDRDLVYEVGQTIGKECQAENVSVILGPAANIKRSPLCGRNFEYLSEDPYLSSQLAGAHIRGVQSQNVGTSLKHFAANNQEHRRMSSSSEIDERTFREIYLASFEAAVKEAKPWTVMCSYNRINGVYASENHRLLTEILRDEWGFDGYVMSDWGAVNQRVDGLKAGLELEMPGGNRANDEKIIKAVQNGELDESVLDEACERMLTVLYRYVEQKKDGVVFDRDADHEVARRVASQCMVLLRNEENILPLQKEQKVAFIGKFAQAPRYQGGGSSHINSHKVTSALEAVKEVATVTYAQGYDTKEDVTLPDLHDEAVKTAAAADVAVIFAGLPDAFESEGYDRTHLNLPNCQNRLIDDICAVQKNVVVVLHNGSPVVMPWKDKVKGILEVYLGGQAVGGATVDVLYGSVNPSGRLAETFPKKLSDNPSYLYYLGEGDVTEYREGVYVGYRYYDKKEMDVLYPFGYGLSYTTFAYQGMKASCEEMDDTDTVTVTLTVKNTGDRAGKEVVQLYMQPGDGKVMRPVRELKGFAKVELQPGEEKEVSFTLSKRSFAYYNTQLKDWHVESGVYTLWAAKNSRELVCSVQVKVNSTVDIPRVYTRNTTFGDLLSDPKAAQVAKKLMGGVSIMSSDSDSDNDTLGEGTADMMAAMMKDMPLRAAVSFSGGAFNDEKLEEALRELNA